MGRKDLPLTHRMPMETILKKDGTPIDMFVAYIDMLLLAGIDCALLADNPRRAALLIDSGLTSGVDDYSYRKQIETNGFEFWEDPGGRLWIPLSLQNVKMTFTARWRSGNTWTASFTSPDLHDYTVLSGATEPLNAFNPDISEDSLEELNISSHEFFSPQEGREIKNLISEFWR